MAIKVIQWATGGVGRAAIEAVLRHPELELVGCRVYSADKSGRDVGGILDTEPIGVTATDSVEDILALEADCVVYSPLIGDDRDVEALLRSGKDVVTPVGWVYPDFGSERIRPLLEACREGGSTLHGSGIHPGGITERFPLMVSALSAGITHVRAEEFSDIRTYGAPEVIRDIMGFGGPPENAMAGPMLALLGEGFKSSVRMVVDELGFAAEPTTDLTIAQEKLARKGLFAVAANDVSDSSIGFDSDENALRVVFRDGSVRESGRRSKLACARWLLEQVG